MGSKIFCILATGESMNQELADFCVANFETIAISDAYKIAPTAKYMVSADEAWWRQYPEAKNFAGRKFTAREVPGVEKVPLSGMIGNAANSGLLAIELARFLGASKVLLCGYDMKGSHFFGAHPSPLSNTSVQRFNIFKEQFFRYRPTDIEIINCTENSELKCYQFGDIKKILSSGI